jgi:AraC-like DNA-binding protein
MSVIINEYKPSLELRPYVELFWFGRFNINSAKLLAQRVIPNGYLELIIHITDMHCELLQSNNFSSSPDYTLIGLFTKPYDVHFKDEVKVFGIRFKPEGMYHTFGLPASEVQESFADMQAFIGRDFREFTSRLRGKNSVQQMIFLSENYLKKNINDNKINLYYLNRAAEIIRKRKGLISIEELASKVYISTRQLEREFKEKIGIPPKSYMRIARLNEVNIAIKKGIRLNLTDLALSTGYSDQAHFIRDFKFFTGESPKGFLNKFDEFIINPINADLLD